MTLNDYFAAKGSLRKTDFAAALGMDKTYLSRLLAGSRLAGDRWIGPIVKVTRGKVTPRDLNPRIARLYNKSGDLRG
jgi:DNA-binding transcriptional regulator YdaS (Cro superfamily)